MTNISPESPEERRKRLEGETEAERAEEKREEARHTRAYVVLKRIAIGVYNEGFIHAGNLAYLSLLTLFPFIIVAAAIARIFGQSGGGMQTMTALLQTMPPDVASLLAKPIGDVLNARSGNLLWLGALVGLWTTGSFIETVRDIIRRAYGVDYTRPFWEYRLWSMGIIVGSVVIALVAFTVSVLLSSVQTVIERWIPAADQIVAFVTLLQIVPALLLYGSLYLIFLSLTPKRYRKVECLKWPGPAVVTLWWLGTTWLLPVTLASLGGYDLTYGSLAGVMIALFFFFIIGLGLVIGAHLNAALAEVPDPEPTQARGSAAQEGTR
jgi:membrane protein